MCIRDRSSDCASMRSRGGTAVLELLATPARAIIIAADPGRHARYRGVPRRGRAGEERYPRDLRVGPVLYRRLPSSGVFHKARRSLRLWASSARELPQAVCRIPTSPWWILLESIDLQPIGLPQVPQSSWSAVSARYSGRSTGCLL